MTDSQQPATVITQRSTVSIALVVVIVGGIVANMSMAYSTQNKVALVQRDLDHVVNDTREIRSQLTAIVTETHAESVAIRSDLSVLRTELAALRARTDKLESR